MFLFRCQRLRRLVEPIHRRQRFHRLSLPERFEPTLNHRPTFIERFQLLFEPMLKHRPIRFRLVLLGVCMPEHGS